MMSVLSFPTNRKKLKDLFLCQVVRDVVGLEGVILCMKQGRSPAPDYHRHDNTGDKRLLHNGRVAAPAHIWKAKDVMAGSLVNLPLRCWSSDVGLDERGY